MIVCICKSVSDGRIHQAVNTGIDTVKGVRDETGACTQCCKCASTINEIIKDIKSKKGT